MTCSGNSVMYAAALNGDIMLIETLEKAGADVKQPNL
jgi:hypothetical protein